jgi:hypothetical protein
MLVDISMLSTVHRGYKFINNVLLVEIEGPVWYTIYHYLPLVKGVNKPLYENQPMRKGHL